MQAEGWKFCVRSERSHSPPSLPEWVSALSSCIHGELVKTPSFPTPIKSQLTWHEDPQRTENATNSGSLEFCSFVFKVGQLLKLMKPLENA